MADATKPAKRPQPQLTPEQIAAVIDRGHRLRAAAMDRFLRRAFRFIRRLVARVVGVSR